MNKSKGFTIIELIVVIAIIAILAAIVMVNVTQYINKSKMAAMLADLKNVSTIAVQYSEEHGGSYSGLYTDSRIIAISNAIHSVDSRYSFGFSDESGWISDGESGSNHEAGPTGTWVAYFNITGQTDTPYCLDSAGFLGTNGQGESNTCQTR